VDREKLTHARALMRAELQVREAARDAVWRWAALVTEMAAIQGLDNAAAEQEEDWDDEVAVLMAVLLVLFKQRYYAAGGSRAFLMAEWAKFAAQIRPNLLNVRNTVLEELRTAAANQRLTVTEIERIATGRALVIGQTTTLSTYNGGTLHGLTVSGAQAQKIWLSLKDSRVRETHQEADGQIVPVTSTFTVGGYAAQYPGDPSLPASEAVNCRCVMAVAAQVR
jgi:hypothetical protein